MAYAADDQLPLIISEEPNDPELHAVAARLLTLDPQGQRMAAAIRRTYDMLLDGQHTGRYKWSQLHKTEKTHFGTLVEINLQREFQFADGDVMDYSIDGIEVDCKFSQDFAEWMIPPEAIGHILLGLWASDDEGKWSAGLIRAEEPLLTGANRDSKKRLSKVGKNSVRWIFKDMPLPENALLHMPPRDVDIVFNCSAHGTKRIDMLFRLAQKRAISRVVVATVAQQDDFMKRIRGNGGSRSSLRPEGIVILGQYNSHRAIAEALNLPIPGPGESISIRLARRMDHHDGLPYVVLDGNEWVAASDEDPDELAPLLPDTKVK